MPRNAAQLRAAAVATGLYDGPTIFFVGDGATIPYTEGVNRGDFASFYIAIEYKRYLDSNFPEAIRLHDWCYVYGPWWADVTQGEADAALYEELVDGGALGADLVYLIVRTFGERYFGRSPDGFRPFQLPAVPPKPQNILPPLVPGVPVPVGVIPPDDGQAQYGGIISMPAKVTFAFSQDLASYTAAWTQSFVSAADNFQQAFISARSLRLRLLGVLGRSTLCYRIRVKDLAANGLSQYQDFPGQHNSLVGETLVTDFPTTALLFTMRSSAGRVVSMWLRGIPDALVTSGGAFTPDAVEGWEAQFLLLRTELTASENLWRIRRINRAIAKTPILGLTAGGTFTTAAAHELVSGTRVRVGRCQGLTYANRLWRVIVTTATTFTVDGWNPPVNVLPYLGGGYVQAQTAVTPETIVAVETARATKKNVGRPIVGLTGAQ